MVPPAPKKKQPVLWGEGLSRRKPAKAAHFAGCVLGPRPPVPVEDLPATHAAPGRISATTDRPRPGRGAAGQILLPPALQRIIPGLALLPDSTEKQGFLNVAAA